MEVHDKLQKNFFTKDKTQKNTKRFLALKAKYMYY